MGYAFQVPSGWVRREEERYKRNELALSPANALETVIFAGASVGATPELTRLGAPREIHGQERLQWLSRFFADVKPEEQSRLTVRVVKPGLHAFLVVTGPRVCTITERLRAQEVSRAWDHFAATGTSSHTYAFLANLCAPRSTVEFERVLETFQVLE
jgi:hypothetical protein